jgi:hypothetical protein
VTFFKCPIQASVSTWISTRSHSKKALRLERARNHLGPNASKVLPGRKEYLLGKDTVSHLVRIMVPNTKWSDCRSYYPGAQNTFFTSVPYTRSGAPVSRFPALIVLVLVVVLVLVPRQVIEVFSKLRNRANGGTSGELPI